MHATVLCVDADADRRTDTVDTLSSTLPDEGEVVGADGVAAASEALESTPIDCAITEYDLPDGTGMDGLGLFVVDPEVHGDRTMAMLRGPFDGRVQVRTGDHGPELRATGLAGQTESWQSFGLGE